MQQLGYKPSYNYSQYNNAIAFLLLISKNDTRLWSNYIQDCMATDLTVQNMLLSYS